MIYSMIYSIIVISLLLLVVAFAKIQNKKEFDLRGLDSSKIIHLSVAAENVLVNKIKNLATNIDRWGSYGGWTSGVGSGSRVHLGFSTDCTPNEALILTREGNVIIRRFANPKNKDGTRKDPTNWIDSDIAIRSANRAELKDVFDILTVERI